MKTYANTRPGISAGTTTLPARYYTDPEHFRAEMDHIHGDMWLCAGRAEQLPEPGSYFLRQVGDASVIVVRDAAGAIRAHHNVCRHRGTMLCAEAEGRFPGRIQCAYHAWTYELDGRLRGAPYMEFTANRPMSQYSLRAVPVDEWGGFLFVNVAGADGGSRQPLQQQVEVFANRIRRYPLADLRIGKRLVYDVAANWKVLAENYNECYHCGPVHPELCQLVPAFKKAGGAHLDWTNGIPHRDGAWTFTTSGTASRPPFPGLDEHEQIRHKGELVYPNLWLSLAAEHVAVFTLYPLAAGATRIVNDFLFHKDEVAKPDFDASDVVDFWDIVNRQDWGICESVQRGMASRGFRAGLYAPMEDASLDIRRYVADRLA